MEFKIKAQNKVFCAFCEVVSSLTQFVCDPYLVVIGAVGAEIRLRTKHLVHHIQAAHGEEITEENQASCRGRAALCGRRGNINPGKGGGEGQVRVSLLLCALNALNCGPAR